MHTQIHSVIRSMFTAAASAWVVGCASLGHEKEVELSDLSDTARATVNREIGAGTIESILKEVEKGRWIYDVEATVGGKHVEYTIAQADGAVLAGGRGDRLSRLDHGGLHARRAVLDAGCKADAGDERRKQQPHHHDLQVGHAVGAKKREIVHHTLPWVS